ncbi:MAG TPA: hypothetical protein VK447_17710, partial [Myxococcaceae bacterium]|nr:hypothetical protein [Myxococcaceae bacterium]
ARAPRRTGQSASRESRLQRRGVERDGGLGGLKQQLVFHAADYSPDSMALRLGRFERHEVHDLRKR